MSRPMIEEKEESTLSAIREVPTSPSGGGGCSPQARPRRPALQGACRSRDDPPEPGPMLAVRNAIAMSQWVGRPRSTAPRRAGAQSPGKKIPISRSADSAESEPCTRFSVNRMPRSPRIVPGRRVARVGRAHHRAHDLPGVLGTLDDEHERRRPADEGDQVVVERLALVLGVVAAGQLGVDGAQLGGDQREALALEAADDLADEAAFDGVGLADDEGAIHGAEARCTRRAGARNPNEPSSESKIRAGRRRRRRASRPPGWRRRGWRRRAPTSRAAATSPTASTSTSMARPRPRPPRGAGTARGEAGCRR